MDAEMVADTIAAENVRRLLRGEIIGEPEYGTLAWHVWLGGYPVSSGQPA